MHEFFRSWKRKAGCVAVALACFFAAAWVRNSVAERKPPPVNLTDTTDDSSVVVQSLAIAGIEADSPLLDSTERQVVNYDRDPETGTRFFTVDGSPVQGKLKAYLDAAREEGNLAILIDHPDGESNKWVEIPKPLFLLLTRD